MGKINKLKKKLREFGVEIRPDTFLGGYNLFYKGEWIGGKSFATYITSWWCNICLTYWFGEDEEDEEYFLRHILQHFEKGEV